MGKEVEYQKSQDSAEHHDNLIWTTTSMIWASNFVLLGFILNSLKDPQLKTILLCLSSLGILLIVCMYFFALKFNSVMRQKYERCKKLEEELGFEQHTKLRYTSGTVRIVFSLITMAFVIIWICVIVTINSTTNLSIKINLDPKTASSKS